MLLYWSENLSDRQKSIFMLIGAVVISVSGNILRNALLTFFHGTGKEGLFVWLHDAWGGDLYSLFMLGGIVLLLKVMDRLDSQSESELDEEESAPVGEEDYTIMSEQ